MCEKNLKHLVLCKAQNTFLFLCKENIIRWNVFSSSNFLQFKHILKYKVLLLLNIFLWPNKMVGLQKRKFTNLFKLATTI